MEKIMRAPERLNDTTPHESLPKTCERQRPGFPDAPCARGKDRSGHENTWARQEHTFSGEESKP